MVAMKTLRPDLLEMLELTNLSTKHEKAQR
jgi:hypothetical protein